MTSRAPKSMPLWSVSVTLCERPLGASATYSGEATSGSLAEQSVSKKEARSALLVARNDLVSEESEVVCVSASSVSRDEAVDGATQHRFSDGFDRVAACDELLHHRCHAAVSWLRSSFVSSR